MACPFKIGPDVLFLYLTLHRVAESGKQNKDFKGIPVHENSKVKVPSQSLVTKIEE